MLITTLKYLIASFVAVILVWGAFLVIEITPESQPNTKFDQKIEVPEELFQEFEILSKSEEETAEQPLNPIVPNLSTLPLAPPKVAFTIINRETRAASVNILCTIESRRKTEVITGSGVIVDPRGVVLTNAHVAQYFLLIDNHPKGVTTCSVRTEDPTMKPFGAKLLYLPPAWIKKHAKDIDSLEPLGTGEDDYAFLLLTNPNNREVSQPLFSSVKLNIGEETIDVGNAALIAGYPARTIAKEKEDLEQLPISSTIAIIEQLFTFEKQTLDLLSLGDTSLSYGGSSGGAVVDEYNTLIGIITSSTDGATAKERELRAITLAHIDRSIKKYTGFDLEFWLLGNLAVKAALYNSGVAPALVSQLVEELKN